MKKIIPIILLICFQLSSFGQETKKLKEKYDELNKIYEQAKLELDHGDVHYSLSEKVINSYKDFVLFLKKNQNNKNDYAIKALDASADIFHYYDWEITQELKQKLLQFALYFDEIISVNKTLASQKKYIQEKENILKLLKIEKAKHKNHIKKITKVESRFN